MDIYSKLDEIGEYIEQTKELPVIKLKLLDKDYLMRSLEELYASIPQEIKEAKDLLAKQKVRQDEIERCARELMDKSKTECEKMLTAAKSESAKLLDQHQLKVLAEEEAKRIRKEVIEEIEAIRRESLAEAEAIRRNSLEQARDLEEKSILKARKIKGDADTYAENIFSHIESNISQIQAINKNGRKFLADLKERDLLETI
jgi:hypothetical protein